MTKLYTVGHGRDICSFTDGPLKTILTERGFNAECVCFLRHQQSMNDSAWHATLYIQIRTQHRGSFIYRMFPRAKSPHKDKNSVSQELVHGSEPLRTQVSAG